jgi:hypothetical protein
MMTGIEDKVRKLLLIPETAQKQFQYRIDYVIAMEEFKSKHPNRQTLHADYVAREIANYMNKHWDYELAQLR